MSKREAAMLGKCFFIICALSTLSGIYTGNLGALSEAVLDGAQKGVELSLSMVGMLCLWCGLMEVFADNGALSRLASLLCPVMVKLFPTAFKAGEGDKEIVASVAANLLGVANAATPFAISAMEKLDRANPEPERASDDMVTLSVLGCSSLNIMPTTIIALRHAAGSAAPYSVILPVIITSGVCMATGLFLCRLTARSHK